MIHLLIPLFAIQISHAEIQFEARVPLNKSGFNKLKRIFPHKYKKRSDLYFEIYNGSSFLLSEKLPEVKMRIKEKDSNEEIQISIKKDEPLQYSCQGFYVFSGKKDAFETELSASDIDLLKEYSNRGLGYLLKDDRMALHQFDQLKNTIVDVTQEGLQHFNSKIPRNRYFVVPSNSAERKRYELTTRTLSKSIDLTLKSSVVSDVTGQKYESYEVEAQPNDGHQWSELELAKALCQFLLDNKFESQDLTDDSHPELNASLNYYHSKNSVFNF